MIDALVIFEHNNLHPFGGMLKRGYRHVWCAVLDTRQHAWVGHDMRLEGYTTTVLCEPGYPLAKHLRDSGAEVIETTRQPQGTLGPIILNNCVGITKAVCGIRSMAVTPWQLRQHLIKSRTGSRSWHASLIT
jgi:hypothetical protein